MILSVFSNIGLWIPFNILKKGRKVNIWGIDLRNGL